MQEAFRITQLTLAGLGEWDYLGNFVPELAADVPSATNGGISPDGLSITWKLKPGLLWSDGAATHLRRRPVHLAVRHGSKNTPLSMQGTIKSQA